MLSSIVVVLFLHFPPFYCLVSGTSSTHTHIHDYIPFGLRAPPLFSFCVRLKYVCCFYSTPLFGWLLFFPATLRFFVFDDVY